MPTARNPSTLPVSALAVGTCAAFLVTIVVSWLGYGAGHGKLFPLPTISTTWDFPPWNFLSRIVVGLGSAAFALLHLTIYYQTQDRQGASLLLFMGLAGALCLALVGAICSSGNSPECMGQPQWHEACAVTFFVLQDVFQIAILARDRKYVLTAGMCAITAGLHVARMWHVVGAPLPPVDPPGVAEFEWSNVAVIFGFMVWYITAHCPDFHVGFFEVAQPDPHVALSSHTPLLTKEEEEEEKWISQWELSGTLASGLTVTVGVVVLLVTYSIVSSRGDLPGPFPQYTPEVSMLFIYSPNNYLSRFFGVQSSNLLALCLVMSLRVLVQRQQGFEVVRVMGNCLSVMCAVSLALALCVNNVESHNLHFMAVGCFFATWSILLALWFAPWDCRTVGFALVSLFSRVRFLLPVDWDQQFNQLELVDVVCGLAWLGTFAWFHAKELGEVKFGLVRRAAAA